MNLFLPTDTYGWRCESETRVPSSRGLVKQYNQELCISSKTREFTKFQSPSLTCVFSPPMQHSTSARTSTSNSTEANTSRKKLRNSTPKSKKCTGSSENTPGSQHTGRYSCTNRPCDQYGHIESSYGDVQRRATSKNTKFPEQSKYCAASSTCQSTCDWLGHYNILI